MQGRGTYTAGEVAFKGDVQSAAQASRFLDAQ
jgi:hypothetical protein